MCKSPSPRRAWIEIMSAQDTVPFEVYVALPTEGVD